jgi:hypothetical protein
MVKDEKDDLVTESLTILTRLRNHFSQLLNVLGFSDVRRNELHTAEPLVPEPSAFEVELAIEKLKRDVSPGIDQIPAELIKAGGRHFVLRSIKLLILSGIRRNCLRIGRSQSLYVAIRRVLKQILVIIEAYYFVNYIQSLIRHIAIKVNSIHRGNYW